MPPWRLLLVDDQSLFLEGLRHFLAAHGFEVVGTAGDGLEALRQARALRPDLILMDLLMPRCDGLEATRLIKAELPDVKIVMLSIAEEDDLLFEAIRSGAAGYLLKQSDADEFLGALSALARGEPALSRGMATKILKEFAHQALASMGALGTGDSEGREALTTRQVSVLTLVVQGLSYKEIGLRLCMTEHTVKYHMRQIQERLSLKGRAEVTAYAYNSGLIKDRRRAGPA